MLDTIYYNVHNIKCTITINNDPVGRTFFGLLTNISLNLSSGIFSIPGISSTSFILYDQPIIPPFGTLSFDFFIMLEHFCHQ